MIWIAGGAATLAGLVIGWAARGARNNSGETTTDWKTRLAARDHDLLEAREQLAAAAEETQAATARAHAATSQAAELRAEVESLRQHAEERDRELDRLEDLVIELKSAGDGSAAMRDLVDARKQLGELHDVATRNEELRAEVERLETALENTRSEIDTARAPGATSDDEELAKARQRIVELEDALMQAELGGGPLELPDDVASRMEELEVELASLESQRCPDPHVHRTRPAPLVDSVIPDPGLSWASVSEDDDDAPLAPVVSIRPLGSQNDVVLPPAVEEYEITVDAMAFLSETPLFDEALYEDDELTVSEERPFAARRLSSRSRSEDGEAAASPGGPRAQTTPEPADDLTQIKGIGPRIGSMLNRMGIRSFAELARLDALEADELSEMFNGLASRLRRGNWIAVAKELHEAKYGDRL